MVRAEIASHPCEWNFCGYREILAPRKRHALIDHEALGDLVGLKSMQNVAKVERGWVEASLENQGYGSESFVRTVKAKLGTRAKGRKLIKLIGEEDSDSLKGSQSPYIGNFGDKNAVLRTNNKSFCHEII